MADFAYVAVDPRGKERRGTMTAANDGEARAKLEKRALYVVKLAPAAGDNAKSKASELPFWQRPITLDGDKLNAKELTLFTRQLATLVEVSPLEEALRTIARQSETEKVRETVTRVADGVVEGRRLSDAMAREAKTFPPLYRAMVSAGESSGALPELLARLAKLLERQSEMRGKLLSALAYPIVLTLVAIGVVAALMIAVVPKVVEQFDDVGQELPFLTRAVMEVSGFLSGYWWLILLLLAIGVGAFAYAYRGEAFRLRVDSLILRFPFIGRLIRDLHAARMARTLATMIESRLPLVEGLKLTTSTVHNRALRRAMEKMVEEIRSGGSLSGAMARASVFPPLLVYLASSGESAGRLDVMLARAADYLEREFDQFTSAALSLLEPMIIVVMGGIVATIVLAILLPILQLQSLIGA